LFSGTLLLRCGLGMAGFPEISAVKCPECGFVSSPAPAMCKRCGHRFEPQESEVNAAGQAPISHILDAPLLSAPDTAGAEPVSGMPMSLPGQPWQDEIAERVARYRRRRSRDSNTQDTLNPNLEFDFDLGRDEQEAGRRAAQMEHVDGEFDAPLRDRGTSRAQAPNLDSIPIESAAFQADTLAVWPAEPAEVHLPRSEPVEIVLGPAATEEEEPEAIADDEGRLAAPIGRRMAAAVVDGLVLLIAACMFTLVFAKTGGQVEPRLSDVTIIVLAVAAASLVTFYFALFTALAFATPGQAALGLRVRTLDNQLPTTSAAVWRGVGYLVSTAALMLGFIWAIFDSQGLTWHDHMSGTCLAVRSEPAGRS
jgi:uncharacterized RDD family membrane protein YckC